MYFINELGGSLRRRTVYTCSHKLLKWSCMIGLYIVVVGVLSEVPVTVGVPEAFALFVRVASHCLASVLTKCEIFGSAYAIDAGSLMNETSCLGIGTDSVGDSPELRADGYPSRSSVADQEICQ